MPSAHEQRQFHETLSSLRAHESPPLVEADPVKARQVLDRLRALLATDDTAANALFAEFEALLRSTFGQAVDQLGACIAAFDYPKAQEMLRTLTTTTVDTASPVVDKKEIPTTENAGSPIDP